MGRENPTTASELFVRLCEPNPQCSSLHFENGFVLFKEVNKATKMQFSTEHKSGPLSVFTLHSGLGRGKTGKEHIQSARILVSILPAVCCFHPLKGKN